MSAATDTWRETVSELLDILGEVFDGNDPRDQVWHRVSRRIGEADMASRTEDHRVEILTIEARQYRDAHAHSQELRSWAERRAGNLRQMLEHIIAVSEDRMAVDAAERALIVDDVFIQEATKPFVRTT